MAAKMSDTSEPTELTTMTEQGERPEPKPRGADMSIYHNKEPSRSKSRQIRNWKIVAIIFIIISCCLIAGVVAAVMMGDAAPSSSKSCTEKVTAPERTDDQPKSCASSIKMSSGRNKMFDSLTMKEIDEVIQFMRSDKSLKLVPAANATIRSNYIYTVEDHLPTKKEVTEYLDGTTSKQPERKARVIIFQGENEKVADYLVWPIPKPKSKQIAYVNRKRNKELSWKSRPVCNRVEAPVIMEFILKELKDKAEGVYLNSFTDGTCKKIENCFYANLAPRTVVNSEDRHVIAWFFMSPEKIADYYMYALPFYIVLSTSANSESGYKIVAVYFGNDKYDSLDDLATYYVKNIKSVYKYPSIGKHLNAYGSPKYVFDGASADQTQQPPQQYYPDGARFTIAGQHVEWLNWEFDIHSRTLTGIQLMNVKHDKERIAYELSMQDIAVIYSGDRPDNYFKNYFDVGWSIGRSNFPLMRGIDCPSHAFYMNSSVYAVGEDHGTVLKDAICVFEHTNSIPLRHHYSTKFFEWGYRYAFSMPDSVLIVRQIVNVWNYDYIFDYEFHQNGAVEVKVASTGYVAVTTNIADSTTDRGFVINPDLNTVANLHQHLFNFKFDLDVAGVNNNFKTIGFTDQRQQTTFSANQPWYQMVTKEKEITKESEAALKYDFNEPKQYVIYNNDKAVYSKTTQKKGYRIQSNSFSKVVIPEDWPLLKGALSWAKYQIAVTKHDDNEQTTASYFTQGDPYDPAVSFDEFLSGDASLNDVDLVAWTTVGILHLPTYEDLPVTTTPGKVLSVALVPFNFFPRDPSIHSRDAAVFWSSSFNVTDDFFFQNDTCSRKNVAPFIKID
ncbi:diamine oxidase [copper-containing]-like [Watersipora subatra]|uniref:diamine oxidase [copper-containing]-like n=1 Tax=Watersipora subatra TaxID=2589382 RepID=UPI00355C4506